MIPTTALASLKKVLDEALVRWVLIGALAANRYRGTPRTTGDVDLLLADTGDSLASLEARLGEAGWKPVRADPEGELVRLTHDTLGTADLLIAGTDYQLLAIERSIPEMLDGQEVHVLAIEDVILHKLIASRFQDLADVEAILAMDPDLDQEYLREWIDLWELEDRWSQLNQ